MANPFVPQLNIRLSLESRCIHCCVHLSRIKNKHATFSSCMSDELALILDEKTILVESYLHSLLDNFTNRYQILCDFRDMQYILHVALVVVIVKGHISNVLYCVVESSPVSTTLGLSGSLKFMNHS